MHTFRYGFIGLLLLSVLACNKTSTVTVNVQQQSAGQAATAAANISVLLVNTDNKDDYKLGLTASNGTIIFNDVHKASYEVSAPLSSGFTPPTRPRLLRCLLHS